LAEYSLDDLRYLMSRLRDPVDGCPWDKQQSFSTIAPHTIEESYELLDAIESGDYQQIKEELGDVLFQVIFYAQLGQEQNQFDFNTIVSGLVDKLIRRHPHVFPQGTLESRSSGMAIDQVEIKKNWETIKAAERIGKQKQGVLDDIPQSFPALTRAEKLQKRAAQVGFDWDDSCGALEKISEEIAELKEAMKQTDKRHVEEELGDLLFSVVNLSRHLKLNSETALRVANKKFEARFRYIEQVLIAKGSSANAASLEQMDMLWQQAKEQGL